MTFYVVMVEDIHDHLYTPRVAGDGRVMDFDEAEKHRQMMQTAAEMNYEASGLHYFLAEIKRA